MKSPGAVACGGCFGDGPGVGRGPVLHGSGGGGGSGAVIRLSAALAAEKLLAAGSDFCPGGLCRMDLCGIWNLPGGSSAGLVFGHDAGWIYLGMDGWQTAAACVFQILEGSQKLFADPMAAFSKNMEIFQKNSKKTICKMEEMGYNRREYSLV